MSRLKRIFCILLLLIIPTAASADVITRVGSWTTGLTHTAGTGNDRLLVFAVGFEHGADPGGGAATVTYGGQPLTLIVSESVASSNGFFALSELWYLDEGGISGASSNTFVVTWVGATPVEPYYSAATYQNVDQSNPIGEFSSFTVDGSSPNPITTSLNVVVDGFSLANVQCGNRGTYTWNNGWTSGTYQQAASSTNSLADNAETTTGTSTASATHSNPNRQVITAAFLAPNSTANQPPVLASIGPQSTTENVQLLFGVSATDIESTPVLTLTGPRTFCSQEPIRLRFMLPMTRRRLILRS
jgi:hypothetical protein